MGDDSCFAAAVDLPVQVGRLDHFDQAWHPFGQNGIIAWPGNAGQAVVCPQIIHLYRAAAVSVHQGDQPFTVTQGAAGKDHHAGVKLPGDIYSHERRLMHLLVVPGLKYRNETAF